MIAAGSEVGGTPGVAHTGSGAQAPTVLPRDSGVWRDPVWAAAALAGFLLLTLADRWAYHTLFVGPSRLNWLEDSEWYKLLRVQGSLWTWGLVALLLFAHDLRGADRPGSARWERGVRVFAAAALAGLLAEVIKPIVGRSRPIDTNGLYVFTGLFSGSSRSANGMPSSHAAVAFGALMTLAAYFPRARLVLGATACGCALSRVISGAHFLTDVYIGAVLGCVSARLIRPGGWSRAARAPGPNLPGPPATTGATGP